MFRLSNQWREFSIKRRCLLGTANTLVAREGTNMGVSRPRYQTGHVSCGPRAGMCSPPLYAGRGAPNPMVSSAMLCRKQGDEATNLIMGLYGAPSGVRILNYSHNVPDTVL